MTCKTRRLGLSYLSPYIFALNAILDHPVYLLTATTVTL